MKKARRYTLLALSFLLISCGQSPVQPSSSESIHSEASIESSEPSLPSSDLSIEEENWDDEIKEAFIEVVGTDQIPYYKAETHDFEIQTQTSDSGYTQKYVKVDCSPVDWGQAKKAYKATCESEGFTVYEGYEDPLAYKEISVTDTLYIQYYVDKTTFTLTLLVYRVTERLAEWPSNEAYLICGGDVPMIEATSYSASLSSASNGNPSIAGCAYGVSEEKIESYASSLQSKGWSVSLDSSSIYCAENETTGVKMLFYYYSDGVMEYLAYNNDTWKYGVFVVKHEYGFNIPTPNFDSVSGYYLDVQIDESSTVFTLYLEEVSKTMYQAYLSQLYSDGWSDDTETQGSEFAHYLIKKLNGKDHYIGFFYSEKYEMIAMPIYY